MQVMHWLAAHRVHRAAGLYHKHMDMMHVELSLLTWDCMIVIY